MDSEEDVKPSKPAVDPPVKSKTKARRAILDSDEEEESSRTSRNRSKAYPPSLLAMMDIDDGM